MGILKKIMIVFSLTATTVILSGCADIPVSISEVMQHPEGTKYYLAHNVWTQGRRTLSSINYQTGTIVPFGTEIKIVKSTKTSITFKVISTGRKYTIRYYEKYGLKPMEEYIKQLITIKSKTELAQGISDDFINAITRGEVLPGMTRREVILAYGPPSPHETPSQENSTWQYWLRRFPTKKIRVIFKGDKVLQLGND